MGQPPEPAPSGPSVTRRPTQDQLVFQLTPQQIQAILRDAGREDWATSGTVTAETRVETDPQRGAWSREVPTGKWTLSIRDAEGHNDTIEMRKGGPSWIQEQGQTGPPTFQPESWIVTQAPKTPPKTAAETVKTVTDDSGAVYQYDPTKPPGQQWFPVIQGNVAKTAKTQAEFDDMQRNEAAGRGFMSTLEYQKLQDDARRTGISALDLQEKIRQSSQKNELDWAAERRLGSVAAADTERIRAQTGQIGAQTAGTEVETEVNRERLRQLIAAGPAAERQAILNNEVSQAQLDKYRQDMAKPSIQQLGTGPTFGVVTPQGTIEQRINEGYVPKTLGEVSARTGQLDALAKQKGAEIQARVDAKAITAEQGFSEFNAWYDSNIAPHTSALEAAREEALYARGKEQATQRQQALQQAQVAGTQAINAYQASGLSRVGGGAAEALKVAGRGAGALKDVDWQNAAFVPTDDPGSVANRAKAATDAAYQQVLGNQPQQGVQGQYTPLSPQAELDRTRYMRAAAPAAAPAMALPAEGGVSAPGAPVPTGDLFAATPPIIDAQGNPAWSYQMDVPVQAEQEYVPPMEQYEAAVAPYQPPTPWAAPQPVRRRRPMPMPAPMPAPVGNLDMDFPPGSLPMPAAPAYWPVPDQTYPGPNPFQGNYVPPNYQYGGMYPTPTPY